MDNTTSILWEEKNLIEPKKNLPNSQIIVPNDIISDIKKNVTGNPCEDTGNEKRRKYCKWNTSGFIKQLNIIHKNKYDYSNTHYIHSHIKINILCPKHGKFNILPHEHLRGRGCKKCYNERRVSNTENFIKKAKKIHGDKYNYSKTNYKRAIKKITIICPIHGDFKQTPNSHLYGYGCKKCATDYNRQLTKSNTKEFIKKAKKIHGNKYDYSMTNYITSLLLLISYVINTNHFFKFQIIIYQTKVDVQNALIEYQIQNKNF